MRNSKLNVSLLNCLYVHIISIYVCNGLEISFYAEYPAEQSVHTSSRGKWEGDEHIDIRRRAEDLADVFGVHFLSDVFCPSFRRIFRRTKLYLKIVSAGK